MRFHAVIEQSGKSATGIEVPAEVLDALAGGKRPTVLLSINGFDFSLTLGSMGGRAMIPLSAERRTAAGVGAGDEVDIEINLAEALREVEMPDDLTAALADEPTARAFLDGQSFSLRKEWARWITEAKKPETRAARVSKAVELLTAGQSRH